MPESNRATVLSLGSVNADLQMRVEQAPGSASMLAAHDLVRLSGGKAANVAYLARRLGCEARLFGRVGDDDLAVQALAGPRAVGVDLAGVARAADVGTGVAVVLVPPSGKKEIVLAGRANDGWSEPEIEALVAGIRGAAAPCILVADYEVPAAVVRRAAEAARARGIPIVIDPAHPGRAEPEVLGWAQAITPNEDEARRIAGKAEGDDAAAVARALSELGTGIVCLKLEGGGCLLACRGKEFVHIPSAGMETVDTTGAGDAFTGALAVALLEGRNAVEAALFAVAASDLSVTAYGAQASYAERERVEAHAAMLERRVRPWPGRRGGAQAGDALSA